MKETSDDFQGKTSNSSNLEANNLPQDANRNRFASDDQHHRAPSAISVPQQANSTVAQGGFNSCAPPLNAGHRPPGCDQPGQQAASSRDCPSAHDPPLQGQPQSASSGIMPSNPPLGFFTARAAESVQNCSGVPLKAPSFNLHLESPSIRKTAGVDHSKTKPVGRDIVGPALQSPAAVGTSVGRPMFTNPQADKGRRVGMPMGAASPLSNRGSYKPPQMKRGADGNPLQ